MVRDGLVFQDEDGQVIFNQYSFCELVKHLLVELVGISYSNLFHCDRDGVYLYIDMAMKQIAQAMEQNKSDP